MFYSHLANLLCLFFPRPVYIYQPHCGRRSGWASPQIQHHLYPGLRTALQMAQLCTTPLVKPHVSASLEHSPRHVSDGEPPQPRRKIALENKTGLASPAPPCVDDPAGPYTRTTFNPTSPRAPVPLLTYVKEWVNLPISDVLAQLKRYLRVILAHVCPRNSLLKIKKSPFWRFFSLAYLVLFTPC